MSVTKQVGAFSFWVFTDGYPVTIVIGGEGKAELRLDHRDLADLEHVVREAKKATLQALPPDYKGEV